MKPTQREEAESASPPPLTTGENNGATLAASAKDKLSNSWSSVREMRPRQSHLVADLIAAVTFAAVNIPQGLAYALMAGVNPVFGLYTLMIATPVGALATSAVYMNVSPTSVLAASTGDALQNYSTDSRAAALLTLVLMMGIFQFLLGIFKLGFIMQFVPNSVMIGFTSGVAGTVRLPEVVHDSNAIMPSTRTGIEKSPCNELGCYLYRSQEQDGTLCVQAFAPRSLLRCVPDETITSLDAGKEYLKAAGWRKVGAKGTTHTALLCPDHKSAEACLDEWREDDALLLIHLYGGIGGPKGEPGARTPLYSSLASKPIENLGMALRRWRTILPSVAMTPTLHQRSQASDRNNIHSRRRKPNERPFSFDL